MRIGDPTALILGILLTASVYSLGTATGKRRTVMMRLGSLREGIRGKERQETGKRKMVGLKSKVFRLLTWVGRLAGRRAVEATRLKLVKAGYGGESALTVFNGARLIVSTGGAILAYLLCIPFVPDPFWGYFATATIFIILRTGSGIYLDRLGGLRSARIRRSLPDTIDLLTVCVEAGLGLDAAISQISLRGRGPLAEEFSEMLRGIRLGSTRRDAMRSLTERVNVGDLTDFVQSLIQADQLGTGISTVMRIQSRRLREKQRQLAQEKAMKAPVKMVFPMILLIFPFMFVIMIGPALIQVAAMLRTD